MRSANYASVPFLIPFGPCHSAWHDRKARGPVALNNSRRVFIGAATHAFFRDRRFFRFRPGATGTRLSCFSQPVSNLRWAVSTSALEASW